MNEQVRETRRLCAARAARCRGDFIELRAQARVHAIEPARIGFVDDDQIEFEISDGVRVRQMRQMISGVRAKGEPAKEIIKDDSSAN